MEDEKECDKEEVMEQEDEDYRDGKENVGSYKVKKRSCKVKKTPTSSGGVEETGEEGGG